MSRRMGRCLPVLLAALAGCRASPQAGWDGVAGPALDGVWSVEFTLESPLLPGHMPRQQTLRGQLALLRNESLAAGAGFAGPPTHSGTYDTRFRPFGFELDGGRQVPALEARLARGDSVEITLQPGAAAVRMQGQLSGDSVAGSWMYDHDRGGAASGRFVMRKRR